MKTVKIKLSRVAQTLVPGGLFALLSYLHMHVFLLHIPIKLPHLVCESKVSSSSPLLMLKRPSYRWAANVCLTLKKLSHPGNVCKTNYCILSRQLTPFPRVYQFPRAQSPPKPFKGLFYTMSTKTPLSYFHSSHPGLQVIRIFIPSSFL